MNKLSLICLSILMAIIITGCGTGVSPTDILTATSNTETIEDLSDIMQCGINVDSDTSELIDGEYVDTITIEFDGPCIVEYINSKAEEDVLIEDSIVVENE